MSAGTITAQAHTNLDDLERALARIDRVLAANEPRYRGKWRQQSIREHSAHDVAHLDAYAQLVAIGGRPATQDAEEELAHAATRCLMALALVLALEVTKP